MSKIIFVKNEFIKVAISGILGLLLTIGIYWPFNDDVDKKLSREVRMLAAMVSWGGVEQYTYELFAEFSSDVARYCFNYKLLGFNDSNFDVLAGDE